jgi:hypothetical protein
MDLAAIRTPCKMGPGCTISRVDSNCLRSGWLLFLFACFQKFSRSLPAIKKIESPLLNRLGAQVFRTVAARAMYNAKGRPKDPFFRSKFDELHRNGVLIWPDFLPEADFRKLENEVLNFVTSKSPHLRTRIDGPNTFITSRLAEVGTEKPFDRDFKRRHQNHRNGISLPLRASYPRRFNGCDRPASRPAQRFFCEHL